MCATSLHDDRLPGFGHQYEGETLVYVPVGVKDAFAFKKLCSVEFFNRMVVAIVKELKRTLLYSFFCKYIKLWDSCLDIFK